MTQNDRDLISYGITKIENMNDVRSSRNEEPLSPYDSEDPSSTMIDLLKDYRPYSEDKSKITQILNVFEKEIQNPESRELMDNTFRMFAQPKEKLTFENGKYSMQPNEKFKSKFIL